MRRQMVFMFSGQGFQYYRMGAELYAHHPVFKFHMDRCDEIVRPFLGASLLEILYRGKGKSEPFDRLLHANPALLSIQYSLAQMLLDAGIRPDLLLGYGLGEITASAAAGLMELEDALRLVIGMARMIEEKTPPAEMVAVFAAPQILDEFPSLPPDCWVTERNFASHFVMTGAPDSMGRLTEQLDRLEQSEQSERKGRSGPIYQKLPVKHGLHTRLVDPIAAEFKAMGAEIPLRRARIPIVSACRRWVLREPDADYFWKIVRYPGEFDRTIGGLLEMGDFIFIDAGPSGTLAAFLENLLPPDSRSIALPMMDKTGRDLLSLEMLHESLGNLAENQTVKPIGRK
jgi:bacillaene synthase trans-acting acyltransferase